MLHVPIGSNQFGLTQPTTTGRPADAQGATVTPAVGSKGGWSQMLASTTDDWFGILICISNNSTLSTSRNSVVDIGIGPSGSEVVLIPNLLAGNAVPYTSGGLWYYFPVFVPGGSRISCRAQSSVTTAFQVYAQGLGRPSNPAQIRKASFVDAIGVTPPSGVAVTGGTTSDGAWTLIGATTKRVWWWQFGTQIATTDTAHGHAAQHVDIAVGNGTQFDVIILDAQFCTTTGEAGNNPPLSAGVEYPVDAGVNVYARIQSSNTGDPYQIAVYAAGG